MQKQSHSAHRRFHITTGILQNAGQTEQRGKAIAIIETNRRNIRAFCPDLSALLMPMLLHLDLAIGDTQKQGHMMPMIVRLLLVRMILFCGQDVEGDHQQDPHKYDNNIKRTFL